MTEARDVVLYHISTHATRGGGDCFCVISFTARVISTHATRGGGDRPPQQPCCRDGHFNPRHPWGRRPSPRSSGGTTRADFNPRHPWGRRRTTYQTHKTTQKFQPTPPVGAATKDPAIRPRPVLHFNPRHPWGRRLPQLEIAFFIPEFQPTPPVGAATAALFAG